MKSVKTYASVESISGCIPMSLAARKAVAKYYVDCPKCMITSEWHKTPDEAIEDFDHQVESLEIRVDSVSEPIEA